MNLTNFDQRKLLEIVTEIHNNLPAECDFYKNNDVDSYYLKTEDIKLFPREIFEYQFDTPNELRMLLNEMWEFQGCDYMKSLISLCLASAFKYKEDGNKVHDGGISAFVYEF